MPEIDLTPAELQSAERTLAFLFAGDATVTLRSTVSGSRFTYRISKADQTPDEQASGKKPVFFVKLLTGSDNENDYTYIGLLKSDWKTGRYTFSTTRASKVTMEAPSARGFTWALDILTQGRMPKGLEIWHSGVCGRCHRKLTDPVSIELGFGPECVRMETGLKASATLKDYDAALSAIGAKYIVAATEAAPVMKTVEQKPTPAAIVKEVSEDPAIKKMADELWEKHPANPKNAKPESSIQPLPVDQKVAEALAQSQGWTLEEATGHLSRRKVMSNYPQDVKAAAARLRQLIGDSGVEVKLHDFGERGVLTPIRDGDTVVETELMHNDWEVHVIHSSMDDEKIINKVNHLRETNPEKFSMDGIMEEEEAVPFWYRHFAAEGANA